MRPCVLITGASSGIGKAIVMMLAGKYDMIINGRDRGLLEGIASSCGNNSAVVLWDYDLSTADNLQTDFESFVRESGARITHFVHSAGVAAPYAIRAVDFEYARNIVNVNALSAMLLTSSLMKRKIAATTMESIVFISFTSAVMGTSGCSVYGASKAMLDGFVKSAAIELAPKVRVNSIRPGFVKSKMTDAFLAVSGVEDLIAKRHPLGIGMVEDIANAVEFLLSEKARWTTGQTFTIDGGLSCNLTFK